MGNSGHRRLRPEGVRGEKNDDVVAAEQLASRDVDKSADADDVRSRWR